jgi:hypothetical protein
MNIESKSFFNRIEPVRRELELAAEAKASGPHSRKALELDGSVGRRLPPRLA